MLLIYHILDDEKFPNNLINPLIKYGGLLFYIQTLPNKYNASNLSYPR